MRTAWRSRQSRAPYRRRWWRRWWRSPALEAWNAVKERRVGSDQVQRTEAQWLLREFENMRFNSGEGVDDYTLRLQNIVAALETVGETIPPRRVVEKLLRTVPKSLRQVAVAILSVGKPRHADTGGCHRAAACGGGSRG